MSKKQIIISLSTFLLGAIVAWFSFFTVADIAGHAPSDSIPLTSEEFAKAQVEGVAYFSGTPKTDSWDWGLTEMVIHCRKEKALCTGSVHGVTGYVTGPVLNAYLVDFDISEWSDEGIISAASKEIGDCGSYTLEANVKTREATVTYDYPEYTGCHGIANGVSKLGYPEEKSFFTDLKMDIRYYLGSL